MANSYCKYVLTLEKDNLHRIYHDQFYGFPIHDDNHLFERLILEINQAGLSWDTILKKQQNFRNAYMDFEVEKVAAFDDADRLRLKNDSGIIRNTLKINAAIENAKSVVQIQKEFGSFENWLNRHHPQPLSQWVKIFRSKFRFVGPEIVNEMLMSTGYLPGSHDSDCPAYQRIVSLHPPFMNH